MPKSSRPDLGHRTYLRNREQMFAIYGDVCHICGHHGAGEADHLVPYSKAEDKARIAEPHEMRPAHGGNYPCPVCGRKCNAERGNGPVQHRMVNSQDW